LQSLTQPLPGTDVTVKNATKYLFSTDAVACGLRSSNGKYQFFLVDTDLSTDVFIKNPWSYEGSVNSFSFFNDVYSKLYDGFSSSNDTFLGTTITFALPDSESGFTISEPLLLVLGPPKLQKGDDVQAYVFNVTQTPEQAAQSPIAVFFGGNQLDPNTELGLNDTLFSLLDVLNITSESGSLGTEPPVDENTVVTASLAADKLYSDFSQQR